MGDTGISAGANLTSLQVVALLENGAFKSWFKFRLPVCLCAVDEDTYLPEFCVTSNLYRCMAQAAWDKSKELTGKMFVYCGPRFTGKTTAGHQLIRQLQQQKGDNYPSLYIDASEGNLYKAFREKLNVPQSMTDTQWLSILFSHLSNEIDLPKEVLTEWLPSGLSLCGKEQEITTPYDNTAGVVPPVIVIDQLSALDFNNYGRLARMYNLAGKHRVLVFILTDKEHLANLIAGMNGDIRVSPVPGRFERAEFATEQADETYFDNTFIRGIHVATGITWTREEWTREKQHEYILQYFPNDATPPHVAEDGFFTFLVEGENPTDARHRANEYFGHIQGDDGFVVPV